MSAYLPIINAFIEDTCVLVVIAYLLARGRLLSQLFSEARSRYRLLYLGAIFGLIGVTEVVFPGARSPYILHTLIITFASLTCGIGVGLVAAAIVTLCAGLFHTVPVVLHTTLILVFSAAVGEAVRRVYMDRGSLPRALLAGMTAQGVVLILDRLPLSYPHRLFTIPHALIGVAANGFGLMMLQLILNEAVTRDASERNLLEVERSRALLAEAQLVALRARVHPHFLFNALTSIAALCGLAPDRAEAAITRLGQLMRRVLETNPSAPVDLAEEIEIIKAYLEIEQHRLGKRLTVIWDIETELRAIQVPAFVLQTLVENAVIHGISPMAEPGTLRIVVRLRRRYALVAVSDSGIGMGKQERDRALTLGTKQDHGLQIAAGQLVLLYGNRARLRLFSRPDAGTLAVFAVPILPMAKKSPMKKSL